MEIIKFVASKVMSIGEEGFVVRKFADHSYIIHRGHIEHVVIQHGALPIYRFKTDSNSTFDLQGGEIYRTFHNALIVANKGNVNGL